MGLDGFLFFICVLIVFFAIMYAVVRTAVFEATKDLDIRIKAAVNAALAEDEFKRTKLPQIKKILSDDKKAGDTE